MPQQDSQDLYMELIKSQLGFLTEAEQAMVRECHVFIPGLGLGSRVANEATRAGFWKMTIVDGDTIKSSNLNRQLWGNDDVGKLKAEALRQRLVNINPTNDLITYSRMLTPELLPQAAKDAKVIVNAIGVEALPLAVDIHRYARKYGITVIEPINLGWGGGIFIFEPDGHTFEQMIGLEENVDLAALANKPAQMLPYWTRLAEKHLPEYLQEPFQKFLRDVQDAGKGWCAVPQTGPGVSQAAVITVTALILLALGKPVRTAPGFISFDPWEAIMLPTTGDK